MGDVRAKVALVTGAAQGIGRATALRLSKDGAAVAVVDLNGDGADAVAAEIAEQGGNARAFRVDVSSEQEMAELFGAVLAHFGGVDILHNNAAATGPRDIGIDAGLLDTTVELWDRAMAVNLRGPMLGCRFAIPQMIERGGGSIINMSSSAALAGGLRNTAYAASKAGVIGLSRHVATQFGKSGVRCNVIAPGLVLTPSMAAAYDEEGIAERERENLVPFLGSPEHLASVVAFLASDDAAYLTGQLIPVDGGALAHKPGYDTAIEHEMVEKMLRAR